MRLSYDFFYLLSMRLSRSNEFYRLTRVDSGNFIVFFFRLIFFNFIIQQYTILILISMKLFQSHDPSCVFNKLIRIDLSYFFSLFSMRLSWSRIQVMSFVD